MKGEDVQKRQRAVKFSRIPKPLSPSDHDGKRYGPEFNFIQGRKFMKSGFRSSDKNLIWRNP